MESASSFFSKIAKNLGKTSPCWNQNTIAAQFMFVGLKLQGNRCMVVALREGNYYKCALDL